MTLGAWGHGAVHISWVQRVALSQIILNIRATSKPTQCYKAACLINILRFNAILKALFIRISNPVSAWVWGMNLKTKNQIRLKINLITAIGYVDLT